MSFDTMYEPFFTPPPGAPNVPLSTEDLDELEGILDDLRSRMDETPQWEFCEGFMAALLCARTPVGPSDYLPVLLGLPLPGEVGEDQGSFKDQAQMQRFGELWCRRWADIQTRLQAEVSVLDDDRCYHPEMLDQRGDLLALPQEEWDGYTLEELPAFGQVWALGFMFAVESWLADWAPPKNKDQAALINRSLATIVALTEDDLEPPALPSLGETPPSVSQLRAELVASSIWAVYDLYETHRELGPRVATVYAKALPGRNEACHCGSGLKFKKCCGR